jgi:hypothetical protein
MIQPCKKCKSLTSVSQLPLGRGRLTLADREVLSPARDQSTRNKGFVIGENIL